MKTFGDGVILKSDAPIKPLEYLHFCLNLPTSVVITGIESQRDLDQAFEAVKTFKPMDKATVAELLERSKPYALQRQVRVVQDQRDLRRYGEERSLARRGCAVRAETRADDGVGGGREAPVRRGLSCAGPAPPGRCGRRIPYSRRRTGGCRPA